MNISKEKNLYEHLENKNKLIELETQYVDYTMDNLQEICEQRKNELVQKLEEFKKQKGKIKGSEHFAVSEYFFKPFTTIGSSPKYNFEKLTIAFGLYKELVDKINNELYRFYPTLSHFCHFLGIPVSNWRRTYCGSSDIRIVEFASYVEDWIFDSNMRLSEGHEIDNVTSIFRSKVELNKVEQNAPSTVVIADTASIEEIRERLKNFNLPDYSSGKKVIDYNE